MKLSTTTIFVLASIILCAAEPKLTIRADRADALYKCGQKAVFTATFTADDPVTNVNATAIFSHDGATQISKHDIKVTPGTPFTCEETLAAPGFLRLVIRLTYKGADGKTATLNPVQTGVAFDPLAIKPSSTIPADFMQFWKQELAKANAMPLDAQVKKLAKYSVDGKYTGYAVSFAAPGGRVYGFMNIPAKPGKHPAMVSVPGAGPGSGCPDGDKNFVRLVMNVHTYDPLTPGKTLKELYAEVNKPVTYTYSGGTTRETIFFHRPIIGISRAIQWLAERPEVDPARIGYYGSSQGGAFGLILTSLNPEISMAVCNVPAMCDHWGTFTKHPAGWPKYCRSFTGNELEAMKTAVLYYDAAHFASFIKVPIRVIVGFIDSTCCPTSVYAAYNSIPSKDKVIYNEIDMGHSGCKDYDNARKEMHNYLMRKK